MCPIKHAARLWTLPTTDDFWHQTGSSGIASSGQQWQWIAKIDSLNPLWILEMVYPCGVIFRNKNWKRILSIKGLWWAVDLSCHSGTTHKVTDLVKKRKVLTKDMQNYLFKSRTRTWKPKAIAATHCAVKIRGGLPAPVVPVTRSMEAMMTLSTSDALQVAPENVAFPEFLKLVTQFLKFSLHVRFT